MPILIVLHGPKRIPIIFFQGICITSSSTNVKDVSIMVNYDHIPPRIRGRKSRHAPSIMALPSLMAFLDKENHKSLSSPTGINSMSIRPGMVFGVSYLFQNL